MTVIDRKHNKTMPNMPFLYCINHEIYAAFSMYRGYRNLVNDNFHVVKRGVNEE
jgi:hypothetical protein